MRRQTFAIGFAALCFLAASVCLATRVDAQTITAISPRTCLPGQTTLLTLQGTDLNESLRLVPSHPSIELRVESVEATQAKVAITLPVDAALGPFDVWLASAAGLLKQQTLLADCLPPIADQGNNHSRETAQPVSTLCAIEGTCDATQSDYYRFNVAANQRVCFEVHTQQLRSSMDPVMRLRDASGALLLQGDDDEFGPDCRFSYRFSEAGEYCLEVVDSRYTAAGASYHLRIGDFPLVSQCFPAVIGRGDSATIAFNSLDDQTVAAREVTMPADPPASIAVQARLDNGQSSTWLPILASEYRQVVESSTLDSLTIPVGIHGRFDQPRQVDNYQIVGTKGQLVRFSSKTRSIRSPTRLQMQLHNAAGAKVTETKVADTDEWSMDFTFPEDGTYRLEVIDLLRRGGNEFIYWIEIAPAGSFTVELKPDAATKEAFAIEPQQGAAALDLVISRFGYDGPINLSLAGDQSGIQILNPRIDSAAKTARVYLKADPAWLPDSLRVARLLATAVDQPNVRCQVSTHALRRIKDPFLVVPPVGIDGAIALAATPAGPAPFTLEPTGNVQFARPLNAHTAQLSVKRIQAEFKAAVEVLNGTAEPGWNLKAAIDKDVVTLTLDRSEPSAEPVTIPVQIFGEFNGHGRLETYELPVQWIDPVKIKLEFPDPLVRGGRARVRATVLRAGNDPQPITLTCVDLPTGIIGSASIDIPADQTEVEFEIQLAGDLPLDGEFQLTVNASSKYSGRDFAVNSTHSLPTLSDSPQQLSIYPSEIALTNPTARQQLLITGIDAEQRLRDWTRFALVSTTRPEIAVVRQGVIYPVADGQTELSVEVGGQRQSLSVQVSNMGTPRPVEFESEVLVALSKQGCNSGACHGSPSGKGGFRLSLRAFDLQLDQLTLIREDFGRRVNVLEPEQSLLLLKPMMKVAHGGGKQLRKEDEAYKILHDWIAAGAAADPAGTPRVTKLEIYPNQKQILAVADGGQQLVVTAVLADGQRRDVTHLVAYESSDTSVATVDSRGFVSPHKRGEVAVLVRLLEYIESVPLMFVEDVEGFQWQSSPSHNYIDELVNAKLKQLQYLPAEKCSDAEFLRRVSLDVMGVLPTVDETRAFLADTSEDKRARWIDEVLQRGEYAKFWALKWGDLLKMTGKLVGDQGIYKYYRWVENSLHENLPYDEFARQLLTGTGSTLANPPANFYRTATDMNECVESISQVFLGARLQCAKCHNHPFERWTQDNYYGMGAFFNRVQRRQTERPGEMFIYTSFAGDVTQPRTGQVMAPWLPQVGNIDSTSDDDRRIAFADWLVNPENPYFARIEANRIWSQLFARGIVDPIDDFRDSNPPSNASLLDALAKDFIDSGYDRKHLLRTILNSNTYQASYQTSEFNREDMAYFSHQEPRLLGAEQLLDAINRTLALTQDFGTLPAGTLATQLPAPDVVKVDFLKVFGQPERSTVCACERADDSNLGMAIELFNGPMMHGKLRDANNRFRAALAAGRTVEDVLEELYLAAVCRPPSDLERQTAIEHCAASSEPAAGLEDVCWALFNTDEFLFQH